MQFSSENNKNRQCLYMTLPVNRRINYIAIYFEADEDEEEDELEAAASLSLIMCCSVMRIVTTMSLYSG